MSPGPWLSQVVLLLVVMMCVGAIVFYVFCSLFTADSAGLFSVVWATWWLSGRVEYGLIRMRGDGRFRLFNDFLEEGVVAVGEGMVILIVVQGTVVDAFADASLMPVGISGERFNITGMEMVLSLSAILHDGGL